VEAVGEALERVLSGLDGVEAKSLVQARYERYRRMGNHTGA